MKGGVASHCTFKSLVCLLLLCRVEPHLRKRLGCKVSKHGQKADVYRGQKDPQNFLAMRLAGSWFPVR